MIAGTETSMRSIAQEIAKCMPGFAVVPNPNRDRMEELYVRIQNDKGHGYTLSRPWNKKDRIHVEGVYPVSRDAAGPAAVIRSSDCPPSITVALERGPEVIAKQIVSRLQDDYLRVYAVVEKRRDEADAYNQNKRDRCKRFAEILNQPFKPESESVHFYFDSTAYGDFTPYSDSCNIKLNSVPFGLAEEIAKLVWAHREKACTKKA